MPAQEISRTIGVVIAFCCFVAAGCATVTDEPTDASITTAESIAASTTSLQADAAATAEPPSIAPVGALPDSVENSNEAPPVATESEPAPPSVSPENIAPHAAELAVVELAVRATEDFEPAPGPSPSAAATPTSASASEEVLDFSSLVTRLRKTKAINLRTKVAVKNESDDLLQQARAYHRQTGQTTLADLRRSYDSLFYKLHSLLQDSDPPLARDIDRSRAAIWDLLADPRKFSASHLMTGA